MTASATARPRVVGLVSAAHPGPTAAVVALTALLATAQGLSPVRAAVLLVAVLAGQLSIGWGNDLVDLDRDRRSGRSDKPLVTGLASVRLTRAACAAALVVCIIASLSLGWAAGSLHLVCVASGWAYNLGLKSTAWSWLPYAVAFGGLAAVVSLADGQVPPWWWPVGAALLGVGAHLLNVLPDLDEDAANGVRGLPHRLGADGIPPVAAAVLGAATAVVLLGASAGPVASAATALLVVALVGVVVRGRGRLPFLAAIAIAAVDVALLVVAR